MCKSVSECLSMLMDVKARGQPQVSFFRCYYAFLDSITHRPRTCQLQKFYMTPVRCPSPSPQHFYEFWGSNSGPHAIKASTLPTKPYLYPPLLWFLRLLVGRVYFCFGLFTCFWFCF